MKKAIFTTGGKQYIVAEGDSIRVELLKTQDKTVNFDALLTIDDNKISVGSPLVAKSHVTAEIIDADSQSDKVTSIRYKAKKRVHKVRGHRQHETVLKISKIVCG